MTQAIINDDRFYTDSLALKSGTPTVVSPLLLEELNKCAMMLSEKTAFSADHTTLGQETHLSSLGSVVEGLSKDDQTKLLSALKAALPEEEQAKLPTDGTVKEQFNALTQSMKSLSVTGQSAYITSMTQAQTAQTSMTEVSQADYQQSLFATLLAIGVDLALVQKTSVDMSDDQVSIAQIMQTNAQNDVTKVQKEIAKIKREQRRAKHGISGFLHFFGGTKAGKILGAVLMAVVVCVFMPEAAPLLLPLIALQASGVLDKATTALANAMGGSAADKVFAAIIITAALVILSGGIEFGPAMISRMFSEAGEAGETAAVAGEDAATTAETAGTDAATAATETADAEGAGIEMTATGAAGSTTVSEATVTATETSILTSLKEGSSFAAQAILKALRALLSALGTTTGMVGVTAMTTTNLVGNLASLNPHLSPEDIAIISGVVNVALIMGSMAAMSSEATASSSGTWGSLIEKYAPEGTAQALQSLRELILSSPNLVAALTMLQVAFQALAAGGNMVAGYYQKREGDAQAAMAAPQADIVFFDQLSQFFAQMSQTTNTVYTNIFDNQSQIFKTDFASSWEVTA